MLCPQHATATSSSGSFMQKRLIDKDSASVNAYCLGPSVDRRFWLDRPLYVLKKTSRDHGIYVYALFVQSFYSFYSHFLLPLFTSLYDDFTSLCSSHPFFCLNTKLYFSPPQSSLHFVSDTEVSLDYIFSTLFLLITTCM